MLYYGTMFLFVGFVAWTLNVARIATVASQGAWILLMSGIVLLLIHVVTKDTIRAS